MKRVNLLGKEIKSEIDTDAQVILLIKKGNEAAFHRLFMKYGKKLYYFSKKKNLSNEAAEGVVQDVFAKIWEIRKNLDERLSINSFIITIAKNIIYNTSRKRLNHRLFEEYLVNSHQQKSNSTENYLYFKDLESVLFQIISELSPRAKLIFKMNRFEGMTNQEISKELNISKKTVENQMHIALKYIRKELPNRYEIGLASILWMLYIQPF